MTIEELQVENEKLQARLQKAITVFGEQKTTIQKLTDENKELTNKVDELTIANEKLIQYQTEADTLRMKVEATEKLLANNEMLNNQKMEMINKMLDERNETIEKQKQTIFELSKKVEEAANNDEKFFEQLEEINKLTDCNKELNNRLDKATESYKQQNSTIESLKKDVETAKNDYEVLRVKSADECAALSAELDAANTKLTTAQTEATANRQKVETTVEAAKKTVAQMQQLSTDLISNFDIFAM